MSELRNFKPLAREPVYLKVYKAIEAEILSGGLAEGALLPTEGEMCAQFGVTRSSVREGIRSLEQAGLVTRGAAKRLVVTRPRSGDVAAAASRGLTLSGATFAEVWETLAMLYPQIAAHAAQSIRADDVEVLREVHARLRAVEIHDSKSVVRETVSFFHALTVALDNHVMITLLQSVNMMIGASLRLVIAKTPKAKSRILTAHSALITAIAARDEDEARRWMAKHIDDLKRGYLVAGMDLSATVFETRGE